MNELKAIPPEALLALALFAGATIHALRQKQVPIAEGLTGGIVSFVAGFFGFKLLCFMFTLSLADVWFFGFPAAYMTNYGLGGMDTVGAQIRDSPVATLVSLLGTLVDEVMTKLDKFKTKSNQ